MFCNKCGKQLPDHAIFCGRCGNKVAEDEYIENQYQQGYYEYAYPEEQQYDGYHDKDDECYADENTYFDEDKPQSDHEYGYGPDDEYERRRPKKQEERLRRKSGNKGSSLSRNNSASNKNLIMSISVGLTALIIGMVVAFSVKNKDHEETFQATVEPAVAAEDPAAIQATETPAIIIEEPEEPFRDTNETKEVDEPEEKTVETGTTQYTNKEYKNIRNFKIQGKWKNIGSYTFGQIGEGGILIFDGTNCNLYSPADVYAFYQSGDDYILECTGLLSSEPITFTIKTVDKNNIDIFYGDSPLEMTRVE